jgi:hypothetical protein
MRLLLPLLLLLLLIVAVTAIAATAVAATVIAAAAARNGVASVFDTVQCYHLLYISYLFHQ